MTAAKPTVAKKATKTAVVKVAPSKVAAKKTSASKTATTAAAKKVTPKTNAAPAVAEKVSTPAKKTPAIKKPKAVTEALQHPNYWKEACDDLMKRDRILKKLIPLYGPAKIASRGTPFITLARSIVGQQISVKAAQSVWERVVTLCPQFTQAKVLGHSSEALASCGLSKRKTEYILDLAQHFHSGTIHEKQWDEMEDEAVIEDLTQIRGIGRWTAEMFLMFNLLRPNILPLDDLGLIKAISVNYFSDEPVTRSEAREVAANWAPWRTVATWYMWRSLDPLPVEY